MVYLVIFIVVIFGIFRYDLDGAPKGKFFIFTFLWFYSILLMGLRYRVGIDSLNYIEGYNELPNFNEMNFTVLTEHTYAPLYLILCATAKSISSSFYSLQILHSLIINTCIFYFIYKNTKHVFIGLFLYFLLYFLYFNTEILRESLAVSCFLINYKNFSNKKWINYYIITAVAISFHYSATLLLLFPLLRNLQFNWRFIFVLVIFIIVLLKLEPYLKYLEMFEQISNKVEVYLDSDNLNLTWVLYNIIQVTIFPLSLLFYWKYILKQSSNYEYLICIHALLGIGILFYQPIFFRFINYTMPFFAIFLADIIGYGYKNYNGKKNVSKLIFLSVFIIYGSAYLISTDYYVQGTRRYNFWLPYHSIFDENTDSQREALWLNQFS